MKIAMVCSMAVFLCGVPAGALAETLVSLEAGAEAYAPAEAETSAAPAEEAASEDPYRCEVMSIEGKAYRTNRFVDRQPLQEGDLLEINDVIEVDAYSWVDVAFDAEWKNVARLEASTKFTVRSIYPTGVKIVRGAIYARLKALPLGSSFEIETPTAVATVRGSEYRAVVDEDGRTDVSNFSDSPVYVSGLSGAARTEEPIVLRNEQITRVTGPSARPQLPRGMTPQEKNAGEVVREGLVRRIENLNQAGRVGKIQDLKKVERDGLREKRSRASEDARPGSGPGGPGGPGGPDRSSGTGDIGPGGIRADGTPRRPVEGPREPGMEEKDPRRAEPSRPGMPAGPPDEGPALGRPHAPPQGEAVGRPFQAEGPGRPGEGPGGEKGPGGRKPGGERKSAPPPPKDRR